MELLVLVLLAVDPVGGILRLRREADVPLRIPREVRVAAVLAQVAARRADQPLGLVQRLGLIAGRLIPGRLDLGDADEFALGVVVPLDRGRPVVGGWRNAPGAGYFEPASASVITSEASRDFGMFAPERFTS